MFTSGLRDKQLTTCSVFASYSISKNLQLSLPPHLNK